MVILKGEIPTSDVWRVMVLLNPKKRVTLPWQGGLLLARANKGELVATVVLAEGAGVDSAEFKNAERILSEAQSLCEPNDSVQKLIIGASQKGRTFHGLVQAAKTDLLITDLDAPQWSTLNDLPCTVAALRFTDDMETKGLHRILMPTAGGPNTVHALQFLAPIDRSVVIDALFISRQSQGVHEDELGRARLDRMLNLADATDRVNAKVVRAASASDGIVTASQGGYDLMVIGSSLESSLDKVLFGDVVSRVVRESKVPVMVVREPNVRSNQLLSQLDIRLRRYIPRLERDQRSTVYERIREAAKPDLDYFVLITLSSAIAALGLVLNSPAVVIGAMLVAPLMSPIVATGMALILGDIRFLRFAAGSALRGALVAIFVGFCVGIMPGDNMTAEVLARTQPGLLDLGVALFSGLAGAFALSYWQAAGALPGVAIAAALVPPLTSVGISFAEGKWELGFGALLLFLTNYVTIALASALVFVVFGFRPNPTAKAERRTQWRSTQVAMLSLVILIAMLAPTTVNLFREQRRDATIESVSRKHVIAILGEGATLKSSEVIPSFETKTPYVVQISVESPTFPTQQEHIDLQTQIGNELATEINIDVPFQLKLLHSQIRVLEPMGATP
ncbi:MAG: DUF389 domain-containing protein [Candidatus Promineifilaceae bacterium]